MCWRLRLPQRQPAVAAAPIGKVTQVNHVSIFVPDVKKSVAFYQDVLGLPLLTRQDAGINLNAGSGFLGVYPAPAGGSGSINHVCFGMENFDADAVLKMLTDRGIKANIRMRGETKELYFTDADGVRVQLQAREVHRWDRRAGRPQPRIALPFAAASLPGADLRASR